ncbi:PREDICTED: tigger transposable element-derived protein 6-like [Amphimedon queenslandica]|uniref:DDE-1 domain-containing protein n=1 Tax=Amphimedon queenslandica TaxID=400682 RepID=A0AAN0ITL1_AMPQE|nr:PREDICTED: tigger transposable element-derived protein 6-like [Amphimedon queenslandica]|eukprot:XP_011408878.1 PREDICTED: tigger transposable element-derived protein 6-like [Amphimedon queenslandica]
MTVSGECGDVSEATVTGWHDRVKSLIAGYSPEDIWNTDETGCFYRALPDKSLSDKAKQCRGGKKAKERLTISLFANAAGGKEAPIVIGKSASPRCFKGLRNKKCPHGLPYYANKKAWMNIDVMDEVILQLNKKMDKFSNVKVIFLHANTTSRLQPQDAGIIKNFKVKYMKKVLKYMLARVNEEDDTTASTICKSVDILMAIRWIKEAWEEAENDTDDDPFAELDELVTQVGTTDGISAEQYVDDESYLSTSLGIDIDDTTADWRCNLRSAVVIEKGHEKAAELQSQVLSTLQDEKLKIKLTSQLHQTTLRDFY